MPNTAAQAPPSPRIDGGLVDDYWRGYYTPDEVSEILAATTTTMMTSGRYPVHVRIYRQPHPAPTVVMAHGMLVYGLALARLQLPFYRAGFNIVQFDIPGLGQSGGPRAGCTTKDIFRAWSDALKFATAEFGGPLYVMGVAEDGVTCYYASANNPDVAAISVHTLFQYGEAGGVAWLGPKWLIKLKAMGLAMGARLMPSVTIPAAKGIPYEDVFGGPGDEAFIEKLQADPLGLHGVEMRFMYSLIKKQKPPVPFGECRTPVQIIGSAANRIWPFEVIQRGYDRLGGPKELVRLDGKPQWESNRDFQEEYSAHVIRWFQAHGANVPAGSTHDGP